MMFDEITETVFNNTLEALNERRKMSNFDLDEINNELEALYVYEGHGWAGRGLVKEAEINASIAAYQIFLNGQK